MPAKDTNKIEQRPDAATVVTAAAPAAPNGPGEALKDQATIVAGPGDEPVPARAGGPGVGAAQVATETTAVRTVALDDVAHRGEVELFLTGRVSAGAILATQREHYARLAATSEGFATVRALFPVATRQAETFDPDEVEGTHVLRALTKIHHDGRAYEPGDEVELGFRAYEELVSIAAVAPIDWRTGEPRRTRNRSEGA